MTRTHGNDGQKCHCTWSKLITICLLQTVDDDNIADWSAKDYKSIASKPNNTAQFAATAMY